MNLLKSKCKIVVSLSLLEITSINEWISLDVGTEHQQVTEYLSHMICHQNLYWISDAADFPDSDKKLTDENIEISIRVRERLKQHTIQR